METRTRQETTEGSIKLTTVRYFSNEEEYHAENFATETRIVGGVVITIDYGDGEYIIVKGNNLSVYLGDDESSIELAVWAIANMPKPQPQILIDLNYLI